MPASLERRTRRFVLIGHPVGHSISPAIHHAAYEALGLSDCSYDKVDCPDEAAVVEQIELLRGGVIAGANVTVPHKRLALALADEADPLAEKTGAANVLALGDDRVVAHNTDVRALADELRNVREGATRAVVIGSGGAALAAVVALDAIGVRHVAVTARRWTDEARSSSWNGAVQFRGLGAEVVPWPSPEEPRFTAVAERADIVVQATSAGMHGADDGGEVSRIVPWERLPPGAVAYDVVYNPVVTPFLAAASSHGVRHSGGLGMLVGQAAHAIEIWLGFSPPIDSLRAAAESALFRNATG